MIAEKKKPTYYVWPILKERQTYQLKRHPEYIEQLVAEYYGITVVALKGSARPRRVAFPRQVVMYLLRKYTNLTLKEIATRIGGRHHTTTMFAIRNIIGMMKTYENINFQVSGLESKITS